MDRPSPEVMRAAAEAYVQDAEGHPDLRSYVLAKLGYELPPPIPETYLQPYVDSLLQKNPGLRIDEIRAALRAEFHQGVGTARLLKVLKAARAKLPARPPVAP